MLAALAGSGVRSRCTPSFASPRRPAAFLPDDDPVLPLQGDDVRHGGHGGQVQALFHAGHALQGLADLQRHAGAAQVRAGIIPQQRVHDRIRFGKHFRRLVVVGDDDREAKLFGQVHFRDIGDAAVHGDQELRLAGDLPDSIGVEAVAFRMAGRNTVSQGRAFLMQGFHQDGSGADAIGVIIAVYKYGVPAGNGFPEKLHGFRHARQQERIMQIRKGRIQETGCLSSVRMPRARAGRQPSIQPGREARG